MAGEGQAEASRSGLGRSFAWGDFIKQVDGQGDLFSGKDSELIKSDAGVQEIDCGCYDG